jgi:hypothetical protein
MNNELSEWCKGIERQLNAIKQDICRLDGKEADECKEKIIEFDLTLPEADIGGLHFNETKVHAVFELKNDGWYHSRDILFLSARNINDDNSRDILTEYLNSDEFKQAIWGQLDDDTIIAACGIIEVSLPRENEGVKKYNGVEWWYWLLPFASAYNFCSVNYSGFAYNSLASSVGGCAPMFRVKA